MTAPLSRHGLATLTDLLAARVDSRQMPGIATLVDPAVVPECCPNAQ